MAIVQVHPKEYRELTLRNLELVDQRKYGSTLLSLYVWLSPEGEDGED